MATDKFKNKTILVTGGTGSIGSEIVRQVLREGAAQVRVFSRDEHKQHLLKQELNDLRVRYLIGDVRDKERLDFAFRGVDICFHAAALKHVPICEYNPFEAVKTNILGTQNVIEVSLKHNIEKVVSISTDKAVAPESVLGSSKLMAERLVTAANLLIGPNKTKFASVRFGNVLNSRGSVADLWRSQIERGGPVTITDKRATRYFMEISDAVQLIFDAAELMQGGEIFVLKMKKRPIVEFADDLIALHAKGKNIKISYVGMRPGEKLHESLLTSEEVCHALETDRLFIVLPLSIFEQAKVPNSSNYPGARKAEDNDYVLHSRHG